MTRQMSSSNTPLMKLGVVCVHTFTSRLHQMPSVLFSYSVSFSLVKAYGELPENAKINETETFGEEEGECTFEFGEDEEVDIDEI